MDVQEAELNYTNVRKANRELEEQNLRKKVKSHKEVLRDQDKLAAIYPEDSEAGGLTMQTMKKTNFKSNIELDTMKGSEAYQHLVAKDENSKALDRARTLKTVDTKKAVAKHEERNSVNSIRGSVRRNSSVDRNSKRKGSTGMMSNVSNIKNDGEEENGGLDIRVKPNQSQFSQMDSVRDKKLIDSSNNKQKEDDWEVENIEDKE